MPNQSKQYSVVDRAKQIVCEWLVHQAKPDQIKFCQHFPLFGQMMCTPIPQLQASTNAQINLDIITSKEQKISNVSESWHIHNALSKILRAFPPFRKY